MICFSCYIWNITQVKELLVEIPKILPKTMIWLENNALWAGLVVIAAAVGIMVIWKKHRED